MFYGKKVLPKLHMHSVFLRRFPLALVIIVHEGVEVSERVQQVLDDRDAPGPPQELLSPVDGEPQVREVSGEPEHSVNVIIKSRGNWITNVLKHSGWLLRKTETRIQKIG